MTIIKKYSTCFFDLKETFNDAFYITFDCRFTQMSLNVNQSLMDSQSGFRRLTFTVEKNLKRTLKMKIGLLVDSR